MTPGAGFRCNSSSRLTTCPPDTESWNTIRFWALGFHRILSDESRGWLSASCDPILTAKIWRRARAHNMNDIHDPMMPRPVLDSQSEMNEIVLPNDTNPL